METLEHLSGVWLHYFVLPPYTEREKNHLNIANNAFADGGNRTRAACAASECAIHYSIASRPDRAYDYMAIDTSEDSIGVAMGWEWYHNRSSPVRKK